MNSSQVCVLLRRCFNDYHVFASYKLTMVSTKTFDVSCTVVILLRSGIKMKITAMYDQDHHKSIAQWISQK
jgi:hypothetical protein